MNYYTAPFQTAAASAHYTARLCYRKSRLDAARIVRTSHAIATHPRTIQAVKLTIWALYVAAVVAYALGQTAAIGYRYLVARVALEVEQAQCPASPTPTPQPTAIAPCAETDAPAQAISAGDASPVATPATTPAKRSPAPRRRAKPSAAPKERAAGGRGKRKAAIA